MGNEHMFSERLYQLNLTGFNTQTIENLGMYNEVSDLYDIIEDYFEVHQYQVVEGATKIIRESLQKFYQRISYLFKENAYQYINASKVKLFLNSLVDVKHPKPLHLSFQMVGFISFVKQLGNFCTAVAYDKTFDSLEEIADEANERVDAFNKSNGIYKKDVPEYMLDTDVRLYIYSNFSTVKCIKEKHEVTLMTLYYPSVTTDKSIALPVHYCKQCGKHFIGRKALQLYDKNMGKIFVKTSALEQNVERVNDRFLDYNEQSELYSWGYNVIEGDISKSTRQAILKRLIDDKKMTYAQISADFERNLKQFESMPSFSRAREKWWDDYKYISDYCMRLGIIAWTDIKQKIANTNIGYAE